MIDPIDFDNLQDFIAESNKNDGILIESGDLFLAPGHHDFIGKSLSHLSGDRRIITLVGDSHFADMRNEISLRALSFDEYPRLYKEDLEDKQTPPMGRCQKAHDRILAMNKQKFGRK